MDLNETICFCNDVTIGMIKDAVDSGAKTLEGCTGANRRRYRVRRVSGQHPGCH